MTDNQKFENTSIVLLNSIEKTNIDDQRGEGNARFRPGRTLWSNNKKTERANKTEQKPIPYGSHD